MKNIASLGEGGGGSVKLVVRSFLRQIAKTLSRGAESRRGRVMFGVIWVWGKNGRIN